MEPEKILNLVEWIIEEGTRLGSLNRLAKALGVTQSTIMRWRNGKVTFLKDDACQKIAQYLGVEKTPEELRVMFGMPAHPWMEVYGKPEDVGAGRKDRPYNEVNIRSIAFQDLCEEVKQLQERVAMIPSLETQIARLEEEVSLLRIECRELKEFIEVFVAQHYESIRSTSSKTKVR